LLASVVGVAVGFHGSSGQRRIVKSSTGSVPAGSPADSAHTCRIAGRDDFGSPVFDLNGLDLEEIATARRTRPTTSTGG
jgi:hypothetical protein